MKTMHTQDVSRSAGILFAVGLTAVAASGCGSASQPGTPATATNSTSTAATATNPAASSPAPGASASTTTAPAHPIDVCAVIPAASAAKLSGETIVRATTLTGLQPQEFGCGYGNADDSVEFEVKVFEHDAASSYDFFAAGSKKASPVNGLGDKAFFDNDGTMYVLFKNNLIQVNGLKTSDLCAALARPVLAAL